MWLCLVTPLNVTVHVYPRVYHVYKHFTKLVRALCLQVGELTTEYTAPGLASSWSIVENDPCTILLYQPEHNIFMQPTPEGSAQTVDRHVCSQYANALICEKVHF